MTDQQPDPLVSGVKSAAIHLGKAGFEIVAALGAVVSGISQKVRPPDVTGDESDSGPERVPVD